MNNIFTAYITRHALTEGIKKIEVEQSCAAPSMVCWHTPETSHYAHVEGREWHRTPESALQRAEAMRVKAIESTKKRLKNLEQIRFTIPA